MSPTSPDDENLNLLKERGDDAFCVLHSADRPHLPGADSLASFLLLPFNIQLRSLMFSSINCMEIIQSLSLFLNIFHLQGPSLPFGPLHRGLWNRSAGQIFSALGRNLPGCPIRPSKAMWATKIWNATDTNDIGDLKSIRKYVILIQSRHSLGKPSTAQIMDKKTFSLTIPLVP